MVLARAPEHAIIWGYVDTVNTLVTLTMDNQIYHTMSSSSPIDSAAPSIWSVTLAAQTVEGPFEVHVNRPLANGTIETITLHDVLFGDVWVCSVQSNMQFNVRGMFNGSVEIANAGNYSKVRLFTIADTTANTPQEEVLQIALPWSVASPASVGSGATSAVCWLFGRMIQEGLGGRPIGLVHTSWGGTDIEYWTPPEVLKDCGVTS
jgi:sialate O-acetylesterase